MFQNLIILIGTVYWGEIIHIGNLPNATERVILGRPLLG